MTRPPVLKTFRESIALLATRRFGTFWFASLLSSIGTWTQQVAEPWLLLTLGASPFLIGLDSAAMNAPILALTLVGGMLADRHDRRRVIALFQSVQFLCPTTIALLLILGRIEPWMIVALSVVVGVTDALSMPSFQSIVPSIVPREQIDRGLALNSTQFNLSRILGPSLAGVLMASAGTTLCFAISAASYVPFIGVASWILPPRIPRAGAAAAPLRAADSIRAVLRRPHTRGALLTVFVTALFCGPLVTFVPVLVKSAFEGDSGHFSISIAAFGAGGLLGAAALLATPSHVDRRWLASAFAIVYGAALVACALNSRLWAIPPLLVVAGAAMTISNTSANVHLQTTSSHEFLGRTIGLYMLALRGGISLGAFCTGLTVDALGVRRALLANGILAIAAQTVLARSWVRSPVTARSSHDS